MSEQWPLGAALPPVLRAFSDCKPGWGNWQRKQRVEGYQERFGRLLGLLWGHPGQDRLCRGERALQVVAMLHSGRTTRLAAPPSGGFSSAFSLLEEELFLEMTLGLFCGSRLDQLPLWTAPLANPTLQLPHIALLPLGLLLMPPFPRAPSLGPAGQPPRSCSCGWLALPGEGRGAERNGASLPRSQAALWVAAGKEPGVLLKTLGISGAVAWHLPGHSFLTQGVLGNVAALESGIWAGGGDQCCTHRA